MGFSKPKSRGPSAEQLRLQQEQADLAAAQKQKLEEQKATLAKQEAEAEVTAEKERQKRIKGQALTRSRRQGRASLITTGSELGTGTTGGLG